MAKNKKIIEGQLNLFDFFSSAEGVHTEAEIGSQMKGEAEEKITPPANKQKAGGFKECIKCWCNDCKHNAVNEGIPRDICGTMQACPACDMCISTGIAEICVIGSAKEGCSVRAAEEGIPVE